jgi:multidrug efflux pump subunit AcrB
VTVRSRKKAWLLCRICAAVLAIAVFSPLILAPGRTTPEFWGMPRTLWLGIVASMGFISLTIWGAVLLWNMPEEDA